jgi:hypothetical protein
VTHQGCPPGVAAAPLVACTHHTSSAPEPADPAPVTPITAAITASTTPWLCRRCARPQPAWFRQGFLRHGPRLGVHPVRPGGRHDHSP